jgi:uncharacterized protein DUF3800
MHGTDDERSTASLRVYMDESGDENPQTPQAVLGGMHIFRQGYLLFEDEWDALLVHHGIASQGIHMRDFGRPHGRYAAMSDCCRRELFIEAAHLIRKYRALTFEVKIKQDDYLRELPQIVRNNFSLYATCFLAAVMMTHKMAEREGLDYRIPFIMDTGNSHKGQIVNSHAFIIDRWQPVHFLHAGGLFFDDDKEFGVLQAADIIAWGARRRASGKPFAKGFEPILEILQDKYHECIDWKADWLSAIGKGLQSRIESGDAAREIRDDEIEL